MGRKDLWQSDYFDDKERFADMINGSLFHGETVIKAEELSEADSGIVHHEKNGEAVSIIRDKVYKWKGKYISICVLENQSYVDYRMVFRIMLEEAVSYIKQQKKTFKKWKAAGYKFKGNEFLSQMRKEEKFIPVITLVLYLGKEAWDGAKSLYELLEIDEELKPFVTNHKINVFDYHEHKDFSGFRTENRFLFELLTNSEDKDKTGKIIKEYLNDYSIDEETARAIFGMLEIKEDIEKYKKQTEKGERINMCKAWDDHKESGRREGMREGMREGKQEALSASIKTIMKNLQVTIQQAMDILEIPEEERKFYASL